MNLQSIIPTLLLLFFFNLSKPQTQEEDIHLDTVIKWAGNIGLELWKIGNEVTKLENINARYSEMKASVEITDGEEILKTIATRMNKLVKEKVDAVLRIKNATMEAEKSFTPFSDKTSRDEIPYYSSKFSNVIVDDSNLTVLTWDEKPEGLNFTDMHLASDPHFNDVLVNTNFSSVHVPTNIFDRWQQVIEPIAWSKIIDETFRLNYEADPSLMWQHFASTSGFLRHYPAFHWKMYPDRYDCRKSIWYIQAATCSKEVVILIDNSGTMYGMRNTIAQLTVDSLLKTFSNNDYISVFRLTHGNVTGLVKCFEDTLIQATPENIELFRDSLYRMCPEKNVDYVEGFQKAYKILRDFMKNKTDQMEKRNQAIFLLTDMLPPPSDFDAIRKVYYDIYNDTNTQVELFIHFIGKDVPDTREIQWEKCLRNGSLVHVRTLDEVPEDALKYLSIMARTQNESTENYPVSWTHIFLDIKKDRGMRQVENETNEVSPENIHADSSNAEEGEEEDEEYGKLSELRIMTSVTTPVYSSKQKNKKEEMIGVAAIDVPVTDFMRMTMPHKIGVNGYAFVVTNNGYLLFHPYLKPVVDNRVRENFNSVDLTEVEFFDDDEIRPRKTNEYIFKLRKRMVNQEMGNVTDMAIKFHYDGQKRVGTESRNYFFVPLKCSPFSLGLALPRGYGNYWVKTTEEIENTKKNDGDYKQYFEGNWTIHSEWTYCDFRNNDKYKYNDRKVKLMKFFDMIFFDPSFVWTEEHEANFSSAENFTDTFGKSCFEHTKSEKPAQNYFCDKELMELLFFDAKLTAPEFRTPDNLTFMAEKKVRLKFVATQGGLTRWQNFQEDVSEKRFGDEHGTALDEVWYKKAVLLHEPDSQTFVLSVPRNLNYGNTADKFICASYAIFYREGGNEAPGVVVGFEMAYDTVKRIAEKELASVCHKDSTWDCYIIDANAYIIYSRYEHEIGKFYGTINGGGALMVDLVRNNIYRNISMFDYQGLKDVERVDPSFTTAASSALFNPVSYAIWFMNWAISNMILLLIETRVWQYVSAGTSCSSVVFLKNTTTCTTCKQENKTCPICCKAPRRYEDICQTREVFPHMERLGSESERPRKRPVDKKLFLYLHTSLSMNGYSSANNLATSDDCSRPYFVKRINYTNLNLLLVRKNHSACYIDVDVEPVEIRYSKDEDGDTPACNKKMINSYPRKKLQGCSDKAPVTRITELCGTGNLAQESALIIISNYMFSVFIFSFMT